MDSSLANIQGQQWEPTPITNDVCASSSCWSWQRHLQPPTPSRHPSRLPACHSETASRQLTSYNWPQRSLAQHSIAHSHTGISHDYDRNFSACCLRNLLQPARLIALDTQRCPQVHPPIRDRMLTRIPSGCWRSDVRACCHHLYNWRQVRRNVPSRRCASHSQI